MPATSAWAFSRGTGVTTGIASSFRTAPCSHGPAGGSISGWVLRRGQGADQNARGGGGMRTRWFRGLLPALGAVVLGTCYWTTGEWESVQRTRGPITQEAYVWQRAWTPAVRSAVGRSVDSFASLVALAAEVDLS